MAITKLGNELVDPGWWEAQEGMHRAQQAGVGWRRMFNAPELIGKSLLGGAYGATAGGLAGAGINGLLTGGKQYFGPVSAAGGILGALAGSAANSQSYYRKRGVYPKAFGFGGAKFSPEAARLYLAEYMAKNHGQ